jgi:branched-chain amino acid transport system substrate-binding protein
MQPVRPTFTRRQALGTLVASALPLQAVQAQNTVLNTAPASSGDIVIGQSAHLTGPLAPTFMAVLKGQELALKEFNDKGGLNGRRIRLVTLDDAYDTKLCVDNVGKLIDEHKAIALFGFANTAGVAASMPLLLEKKVPLIGVYSGSPSLRAKQHPYFFTTTASYRDEVVQMMRNQAVLGRSRVGLVYNNSAFGKLMQPVVEEVAKEQGITIVAKASLEMSGADAVAATQAMAAERPQAIIVMAFGPSLLPFIKAARAQLGVPLYLPGIANARQLIEALGDEARGLAYTVVIPYPFTSTRNLTRDFSKAMAAIGVPVDYDHFFGYVNTRALLAMLVRAGKTITPQTLVSAIERMQNVDIGGYVLGYSPTNHHGSKFVETVIVGPGGRYMR